MKNAPNQDTIILWSAIIAGIGLLALLVRHAAIYRFGTDTFTGNVLFGVIFILLVGLYLGFQSVIEDFPAQYPISSVGRNQLLSLRQPPESRLRLNLQWNPK